MTPAGRGEGEPARVTSAAALATPSLLAATQMYLPASSGRSAMICSQVEAMKASGPPRTITTSDASQRRRDALLAEALPGRRGRRVALDLALEGHGRAKRVLRGRGRGDDPGRGAARPAVLQPDAHGGLVRPGRRARQPHPARRRGVGGRSVNPSASGPGPGPRPGPSSGGGAARAAGSGSSTASAQQHQLSSTSHDGILQSWPRLASPRWSAWPSHMSSIWKCPPRCSECGMPPSRSSCCQPPCCELRTTQCWSKRTDTCSAMSDTLGCAPPHCRSSAVGLRLRNVGNEKSPLIPLEWNDITLPSVP
ncbi:Large T antigen [Frankliniella fusca]|uniref:Large T antigen n=1 Tax=Frankliniella fusca TaxID=407009 RepID=A0AAE1LD81_9NEOP|nr:Large T antigen [Frankliniella fusca]